MIELVENAQGEAGGTKFSGDAMKTGQKEIRTQWETGTETSSSWFGHRVPSCVSRLTCGRRLCRSP